MIFERDIDAITSCIKDEIDNGVIVLAGAGCSCESGLPTVYSLIKESVSSILKYTELSAELKKKALEDIPGNLRLEVFFSRILDIVGDKGYHPLTLLQGGNPTALHFLTGELLNRGYIKHVLTTNFDNLFEMACDPYSLKQQKNKIPKIVKLHGSIPRKGPINSSKIKAEIKRVARGIDVISETEFNNLVAKNTLLVLGYSGRDYYGAMPILYGSEFKKIIWVQHTSIFTVADENVNIKNWLSRADNGIYIYADTSLLISRLAESYNIQIGMNTSWSGLSWFSDPFKDSGIDLKPCAELIIAVLFREAGFPSEAYDCLYAAIERLELKYLKYLAMCYIESAQICLTGFGGQSHESLGLKHAEHALMAVNKMTNKLSWDAQVLEKRALLTLYDIYISIPTLLIEKGNTVLWNTQNIIEWAESNGETMIAAEGCKLLARLIMNNRDKSPATLEVAISAYEDSNIFAGNELAEDVLASSYYWLGYLYNCKGDTQKCLEYDIKRLKCLLLLRQTPEHEHIKTCLKMIKRNLVKYKNDFATINNAYKQMALLGIVEEDFDDIKL
jgi:hypothetical protein